MDKYNDYDDIKSSGGRTARRNQENSQKKRSLVAVFFTVLAIVLGIYCVFVLAYFAYTYINDDPDDDGDITVVTPATDSTNPIADLVASKPKLKERTNFAILGTDEEGTRTDTIIVGCYNSVTNNLDLISIPRDTVTMVDYEDYLLMNEEYPEPGSQVMRFNAIYHFGGEKYGLQLCKKYIEKLLDCQLNYYIIVDFDAFDYLIDSIGGVEYDVPMDMDYEDPAQDLYIHLKAGKQMLNGEQAEGLVRFRYGYADADIGRISTQQKFIKELVRQLLDKDTIFSNATAYITTFFKYIKTDVKISDAVKYMSVIKTFDPERLNTFTVPYAETDNMGIVGGYTYDENALNEITYNIFKKSSMQIIADEKAAENGQTSEEGGSSSKGSNIEVLNGGYKNGAAQDMKEKLEAAGYTVNNTGSYEGGKQYNDRIYVSADGMGTDLVQYLNSAEIIVDSTVTGEHDIVIVIGTGENNLGGGY